MILIHTTSKNNPPNCHSILAFLPCSFPLEFPGGFFRQRRSSFIPIACPIPARASLSGGWWNNLLRVSYTHIRSTYTAALHRLISAAALSYRVPSISRSPPCGKAIRHLCTHKRPGRKPSQRNFGNKKKADQTDRTKLRYN